MKRMILMMWSLMTLLFATEILSQSECKIHSKMNHEDADWQSRLEMSEIKNAVNPELAKGMQASVVVVFKDTNLEQVIREVLNKPTGDITDVDMMTITSLTAGKKSISDLTGLEYGSNLEQIELGRNQISNIYTLGNLLKLELIDLHFNDISDISALKNLKNLETLSLKIIK